MPDCNSGVESSKLSPTSYFKNNIMNIYLLSQDVNNGYDTYDSMVVVSDTAENAIKMSVDEYHDEDWSTWAAAKDIKCTMIGVANTEYKITEIILASFNAG